MPPKPRLEPLLVDTAIHLFGESGFEGVTVRRIADKVETYEHNIYRLFGSKERLYIKALTTVVDRSRLDMDKFVSDYSKHNEKNKVEWFLHAAIHRWYASLSRDGARMLQQVMISDQRRRDRAFVPIEKIIKLVAKAIGQRKPKVDFDPKTRAEALIMILFQLKVSYRGPAENEMNEVDRFLGDWIKELLHEESARRGRRVKAAS